MNKDYSVYIERRKTLVKQIKEQYKTEKGLVLFFAPFEGERNRFRQDSTLYYLSGLVEPGMVLAIDLAGQEFACVPQYAEPRNKWASSLLYGTTKETIKNWGLTDIQYLGNPCKGYSMSSSCGLAEYESLVKIIKDHVAQGNSIFTTYCPTYTVQRMIIDRLMLYAPEMQKHLKDVSDIVAAMRRTKTRAEIELLFDAAECTMAAHEAAAGIIDIDKHEYEIQAGIEFMFTQSGGSAAFPSIVATGGNATVLHYTENRGVLKRGDLVVVDIGAELDYYCADVTRTYPVSGVFTKRQKELYNIVLETQEYIESLAKPGMWLNNKNYPEQSLHHLAKRFLDRTGYGQYFTHGIGHYLGLDVHDVGSYAEPLKAGDVFTIEPGIYIPEEKIGIRIEDDYWIVDDGAMCLTQELPKNPHQIEEFMAQDFEEDDYEDELD